jgi:putative ABC transport system substrate-binding protein
MKEVRDQRSEVGKSRALSAMLFSLCFLGAMLLALSFPIEAQQPGRVPHIGYLAPAKYESREEAFRQGLHELGYVEGRNIVIEWRIGEPDLDRLRELAGELVRLKVDIIVATSTFPVQASKEITKTIPIVFAGVLDPIGSGFVASLARPGGNITGLSLLAPELNGKRLEILKEAFPKISRVAVLWNTEHPATARLFEETKAAARELKVTLQSVEVRGVNDFDGAFATIRRDRSQGLLTIPDPLTNAEGQRIADFAAKNRLPAIYDIVETMDAGGLMAYGVNRLDPYRRAATYVDKILKGAKPADLPVEQPTKFEFVINLKASKQIGLTIPPTVLVRADKVIK